jgi:hypothetical protein
MIQGKPGKIYPVMFHEYVCDFYSSVSIIVNFEVFWRL